MSEENLNRAAEELVEKLLKDDDRVGNPILISLLSYLAPIILKIIIDRLLADDGLRAKELLQAVSDDLDNGRRFPRWRDR